MRWKRATTPALLLSLGLLTTALGCNSDPSRSVTDRTDADTTARSDADQVDAGPSDTADTAGPPRDTGTTLSDTGTDADHLDSGRTDGGDTDTDETDPDLESRSIQWTELIDDRSDDRFNDVAVGPSENVYVAGDVTASVDGDTYEGGPSDALVAKYTPDGTRQWVRLLGTAGEDRAVGIDVTNQGGNAVAYIAWNGKLGSDKNVKARITRMTGNGNGESTRKLQVDASWPVQARDVAVTQFGIRVVGEANAEDFGQTAGGDNDAFVATFDEGLNSRTSIDFRSRGGSWDSGAAIVGPGIDDASRWVVVHGGASIVSAVPEIEGSETIVRPKQHAHVSFDDIWSFDIGYLLAQRTVVTVGATANAPGEEPDVFVTGHSSGSERFTTTFGTDEADFATGVGRTDRDTFWVTGAMGRNDRAGESPARGYLARFDAEGRRQNLTKFGAGIGDTIARGLATGRNGEIYVVGSTRGTVGGTPENGATTHGAAFLTKFDVDNQGGGDSCKIDFDDKCPDQTAVCDVRFDHGRGCQSWDGRCSGYGRAYFAEGDRDVEITFETPVERVDVALYNSGEPGMPVEFFDAQGNKLTDVSPDWACPDKSDGIQTVRFERPAVSATVPPRLGRTLIDEMTVYYANSNASSTGS